MEMEASVSELEFLPLMKTCDWLPRCIFRYSLKPFHGLRVPRGPVQPHPAGLPPSQQALGTWTLYSSSAKRDLRSADTFALFPMTEIPPLPLCLPHSRPLDFRSNATPSEGFHWHLKLYFPWHLTVYHFFKKCILCLFVQCLCLVDCKVHEGTTMALLPFTVLSEPHRRWDIVDIPQICIEGTKELSKHVITDLWLWERARFAVCPGGDKFRIMACRLFPRYLTFSNKFFFLHSKYMYIYLFTNYKSVHVHIYLYIIIKHIQPNRSFLKLR